MTDKALWCASLSDGSTFQEGRGEFQVIEGQPSPFQRLLLFVEERNLRVTSLSLYCGDRHWSLPSAGRNPKFRAFEAAPKPESYRFFRAMGADQAGRNAGVEDRFAVVEARYASGLAVQVWVEDGTLNSWAVAL